MPDRDAWAAAFAQQARSDWGVYVSVSELRADLERLLDHVLETGEPLVIERNGRTLRILADRRVRDLAALPKHPEFIVGDPDALVHMDWFEEWKPSR